MNTWRLDPLDPLIFGNGKPATNGAAIESLPLPWPTTVAGAFRTRVGSRQGFWDQTPVTEAQSWSILGPLLTCQEKDGTWKLLVPAPADALLLEPEKPKNPDKTEERAGEKKTWDKATRRRLQVLNRPEGVQSSVPPVGLSPYDPAKPYGGPPALWTWEALEKWLGDSQDPRDHLTLEEGHGLPAVVRRVHVGIDPETQRASDGLLFTTEARDFSASKDKDGSVNEALSLVLWSDAKRQPTPGIGQLGGERRMVRWEQSGPAKPPIPDELREKLAACGKKGFLRVQLLTPALFRDGSIWTPPEGVEVVAQISGRPHPVSGWDLAAGGPKKMQRMVPAGSVYFVKITENELAKKWIDGWWFQSICEGQAKNDGLGLAVVGCWDGPVDFELGKKK